MNPLTDYIQNHKDWIVSLREEPYNLIIATDDMYPGLYLFKYNQIKSDMSLPVVQTSRGIILEIIEDSIKVICYPFDKFFNYNDVRSHKVNWKSASVLEKVDGSIIKFYYYNNTWKIATNGCIDAFHTTLPLLKTSKYQSFGDLATDAILTQNIDLKLLDPAKTYIFELTSPYNRVVVPHNYISLTHLGTRINATGVEVEDDIKVKKPKKYSFTSFEDAVASSEVLPYDEEGYIVVDDNYNRVKVKSLAYLQVHHLADNGVVSQKRLLTLIKTGEDGELLKYYPEYTEAFNEVRAAYSEHLNVVNEITYCANLWKERYINDKAYAMQVIKHTHKKMHPYFFAIKNKKQAMLDKLNDRLEYEDLLNRRDHVIN